MDNNPITLIDLQNTFHSIQDDKNISDYLENGNLVYKVGNSSEYALYCALLQISNKVAFKEFGCFKIDFFFPVAYSQIKRVCHLSEETICKARRTLKEKKLIDFKEGTDIHSFSTKNREGKKQKPLEGNNHVTNMCQYKICILPKNRKINETDEKLSYRKTERYLTEKPKDNVGYLTEKPKHHRYIVDKDFFMQKEKSFIEKISESEVRDRLNQYGTEYFNLWIDYYQKTFGSVSEPQAILFARMIFIGLEKNTAEVCKTCIDKAIKSKWKDVDWQKQLSMMNKNINPPEVNVPTPKKATFTKLEERLYTK